MSLSFDKLREKEVINARDGRDLGCICDMELHICTGRVTHIILPTCASFIVLSHTKNKIYIPWENIDRIGEDVIIVRCADIPEPPPKRRKS